MMRLTGIIFTSFISLLIISGCSRDERLTTLPIHVLEGNGLLTLESQSDIDACAMLQTARNTLRIGPSSGEDAITDLSPLGNLRSIGSQLIVEENEQLQSLVGLESLTECRQIQLRRNPRLADIAALANV